jgi:hypothetical protein
MTFLGTVVVVVELGVVVITVLDFFAATGMAGVDPVGDLVGGTSVVVAGLAVVVDFAIFEAAVVEPSAGLAVVFAGTVVVGGRMVGSTMGITVVFRVVSLGVGGVKTGSSVGTAGFFGVVVGRGVLAGPSEVCVAGVDFGAGACVVEIEVVEGRDWAIDGLEGGIIVTLGIVIGRVVDDVSIRRPRLIAAWRSASFLFASAFHRSKRSILSSKMPLAVSSNLFVSGSSAALLLLTGIGSMGISMFRSSSRSNSRGS